MINIVNDNPEQPTQNPVIPEGINAHQHNPFKELLLLLSSLLVLFVVVTSVLWYSLSWGAQFIPLSWELRLAQPFIDQQATPSETEIALQERLDRLLAAMEYENDIPIQVHHLDSETVNAFATLGGQIFVFQGLLDIVKTDIGLDMVLAHEAAHILNRDPIQGITAALGVQFVFALATGNTELAQLSNLMGTGSELFLLSYSRKQERAADALAMDTLAKLYPDLTGADELFHYMLMHSDDMSFPEFLSSHPNVEDRINTIQERIKQPN